MVKKILNIVFWAIIGSLFTVWLTDFLMVNNEKDPIFCISKKTHEYNDGTTKECTGLGYKVYEYDRESIDIKVQFSPFFIDMKK